MVPPLRGRLVIRNGTLCFLENDSDMSKSKAAAKQAFATPDRESSETTSEAEVGSSVLKKTTRSSSKEAATDATPSAMSSTVTPPESASRELAAVGTTGKEGEKHVRFGRQPAAIATKTEEEEVATRKSKRGLVSRRGGRYGSPSRFQTTSSAAQSDVLEFKTYRSPSRKKDDNDTVPTLCSTGSELDGKKGASKEEPKPATTEAVPAGDEQDRRPSSISLDKSMVDTTSPLASHDVGHSPSSKAADGTKTEQDSQAGIRNVTFSPAATPAEPMGLGETPRKTPSRSPSAGRFHTLPSLSESKGDSAAGIFLSPSPPHASAVAKLKPVSSFDLEVKGDETNEDSKPPADPFKDKENHEAVARDQERERVVATPTDFTFDFGKGHQHSSSFDASNVLAWLQSPTANGMFSPGGFNSAANTPRPVPPRTPRTPQVTTSFFFSDVAGLPRNSDYGSPRAEAAARRGQGGYGNSMICVSPLASRRGGNVSGRAGFPGDSRQGTPYRDVFASPRHPGDARVRGLPFLGESPAKASRGRPLRPGGEGNLESMHMAERDLMEDEDLSVLLQLASHSTPCGVRDVAASSGSHVFRPGGDRKGGEEAASGNLAPGLQLPVIGGQTAGATKLSQKSSKESVDNSNEFMPPPLAIRSSSSGGSREIVLGKGGPKPENVKSKDAANKKPTSSKGGPTSKIKGPPGKMMYPIPGGPHPYPPGPDLPPYYPLPGSIPGMPRTGSMRVSIGGPPPKDPGSSPARLAGSPHRPPFDGKFHRPPPFHPMYPPPHHPMGGMPHYYPPPPHPHHMPMFSGPPQGPPPPSNPAKGGTTLPPKKGKGPKGATKRPTVDAKEAPPPKKPRKTPGKPGRKKKTTPTPTDPAERQKTAAAIQAMNAAGGGGNDKAASLAAAIMRGVTMRPSGKWQAQLYFAGKSRYIGVFDSREKAALAYEIAREKLKESGKASELSLKATEAAVNLARKAAFEGVNERDRVK